MEKMRIPNRKILNWFLKNYVENPNSEAIEKTLTGLKMIIEENRLSKLGYIGKFLVELSNSNQTTEEFLNELAIWGF